MLIEISRLKKTYKDVEALRGVDLVVTRGEVVGILGPNGAGKTTLLEIIEGLLPFDEGAVSVLGIDVGKKPDALRGKLNVTMQATALPPAVTVGELASLYQSIYGLREPYIDILKRVGMERKAKARIGRLSGGEKQRLAVALALIGTAELMVLDEPTSQLDPQGRRLVWESIARDVRAGRRTVIITTHQMEEAAALCSRVVIVDAGRVIADGAPAELIQSHCPGANLVFRCGPDDDLAALAQLAPGHGMTETPDGALIRISCNSFDEAISMIRTVRESAGVQTHDLRIESMTLEDVFLKLTGKALD